MAAKHRHEHLKLLSEALHNEAFAVLQILNSGRDHVAGMVFNAVIIFLMRPGRANIPKQRLIAVEHAHAARQHIMHDLQLGLQDALPRAEMLDVHRADVGNQRNVRLCDLRQIFHFAEVVHAHFEHGNLGVPRHIHDRHRQSQAVVLVALRLGRAERRFQQRRGHLLRRRLADGAGNAHHLHIEHRAVSRGNRAVGLHCVLHLDGRQIGIDRAAHQRSHRAVADRGLGKVVAVHLIALECNKQVSASHLAGIRLNSVDAERLILRQDLAAAPYRDLFECQFFHTLLSKYDATTSRSSRCLFS